MIYSFSMPITLRLTAWSLQINSFTILSLMIFNQADLESSKIMVNNREKQINLQQIF